MTQSIPTYPRTLAIAPSARGFGFAVMDGFDALVNWGVKGASGNKNQETLKKVRLLIEHYDPELVVMSDLDSSRRAPRINRLHRQLVQLIGDQGVKIVHFPIERVRQLILKTDQGTKHDLALALADRYPDELALRVPAKRKLWQSEDSRLDMFEAVALALMVRITRARQES